MFVVGNGMHIRAAECSLDHSVSCKCTDPTLKSFLNIWQKIWADMCINKINEPFKLAYHILCSLCEPEPYLFLKSKNKHLLSFWRSCSHIGQTSKRSLVCSQEKESLWVLLAHQPIVEKSKLLKCKQLKWSQMLKTVKSARCPCLYFQKCIFGYFMGVFSYETLRSPSMDAQSDTGHRFSPIQFIVALHL